MPRRNRFTTLFFVLFCCLLQRLATQCTTHLASTELRGALVCRILHVGRAGGLLRTGLVQRHAELGVASARRQALLHQFARGEGLCTRS